MPITTYFEYSWNAEVQESQEMTHYACISRVLSVGPSLVGWLVIEVEHLYIVLKQSTNAVPNWALSRTSHSIATQCNN